MSACSQIFLKELEVKKSIFLVLEDMQNGLLNSLASITILQGLLIIMGTDGEKNWWE